MRPHHLPPDWDVHPVTKPDSSLRIISLIINRFFPVLLFPILFASVLILFSSTRPSQAILPDHNSALDVAQSTGQTAEHATELPRQNAGTQAQQSAPILNPNLDPERLSPRVIVELASMPLAEAQAQMVRAAGPTAKLDVAAASAAAHLAQLEAEQSLFAANLAKSLPGMKVSVIRNESGIERTAAYSVIFNGMAVHIGGMERDEAMAAIGQLDGVKAVYPDKPYMPLLYESVGETRAPEVWNLPAIGGFENAGRGISIASIDSGVYGRADMFSGDGYTYPATMPVGGYGETENNTGKVIVSRAYFRDWDGPLPGEERGWPGSLGSSHGTHTASTAAGDLVTDTVEGAGVRVFSGMAPKAYVMSYKVNYGSELDMPFFFTPELLMAMEDAVIDGADVVNNSWGGGPDSSGGELDAVDQALINVARAGVFVSMSTGNSGPGNGTVDHPSSDYISVAAGYGTLSGGNLVGYISEFSSRGPAVGNVLKPDITAPGDEVYAQGYGPCCGEDRHQGYGAVSGTSMAAPHVSGAAALLKQVHPTWSNQMIKSALMSTAQYTNIFREEDGETAQPLDMGAGWMNVAAAVDPGVILDPPSVSFGLVAMNTERSQLFQLTNITGMTETYTVTTHYQPDRNQSPTAIPGFTTSPPTVTVGPGDTASVTITFDSAAGIGFGDNQGYVVLTGDQHDAHLATWARVSYASPLADVLILDNDGSDANSALYADVAQAYKEALDELGYTYQVHAINKRGATPRTVPHAAELSAYKAVIIVTGDNGRADTPDALVQSFTEPEMDRVVEYLNNGGVVIGMGANMARVMLSDATDDLRAPFLYRDIFRSNWIQDSVSFDGVPQLPLTPSGVGPPVLSDILVSISNTSMDEIDFEYHNGWPLRYGGTPLFQYLGAGRKYFGITGMMSRDQPSLNTPGITYRGRSIYTTFGLEDVVDNAPSVEDGQPISRTALLDSFLNALWSEPATIEISATAPITTGQPYLLSLDISGGTNQVGKADTSALAIDEVLWDYGDASEPQLSESVATRSHSYYFCNTYNVRVVTLDQNANIAVNSKQIVVSDFCVEPMKTYMPMVLN